MSRFIPDRDDLVDAGFLVALGVLALLGFSTAYGGSRPVAAGLIGLLLGILVAFVGVRLKLSPIPLALVGIATFFLLGGVVAVRDTTLSGLPTVATLGALADGAIRGWARLVTIVPPAGDSGNLMVIPFLSGLACGLIGFALARRHGIAWLPALLPAAVLGLGILLGTLEPASLVLQGAAFVVVLMLWVSMRGSRGTRVVHGVSPVSRIAGALALLGLVAAGAVFVGPHLPMANANERLVLRDHVDPPFDPRDYPSPLLRMRKYAAAEKNTTIFTATGIPAGARIRLATMDLYDGTVWNVAGGTAEQAGSSGYFERMGDTIPPADGAVAPSGQPATVTFTVGDYSGVWVPGVGAATAVDFGGQRGKALADTFRYNRETSQAVVTAGLAKDDTVIVDAMVPATMTPEQLTGLAGRVITQPEPQSVPPAVAEKATDLVGEARTAGDRAVALGASLREQGFFSQGQPGQGDSIPGHSARRLSDFLDSDALLGDAEQYAATAALMARKLGLSTRVVLGWVPTAPGTYVATGKDVTAWIEVLLDGPGWVPIDVTPDRDKILNAQATRPKPQPQPDVPIAPQTKVDLAPPLAAPADEVTEEKPDKPADDATGSLLRLIVLVTALVGIPLALVGIPLLAIVSAKARRRRRRIRAEDPAVRIAGGWEELLDRARDERLDPVRHGTRTETAAGLGGGATVLLAERADSAVFGPHPPTVDEADDYWARVADVNRDRRRELGLWARWRASVSMRSLRGRRRTGRGA